VQKIFKNAVKVWSDATCVDFVEDKNAQDKVVVVKGTGCFSNIGRIGGDQLLCLGDDHHTERSALHEIGHVLGFFHTMQRFDRDSYVKIIEQNIEPNSLPEFTKVDKSDADVYGLKYDYGSIMHYADLRHANFVFFSHSTNQRPTIIAIDHRYQKTMGSEIISFSDIFMINEHYGCNAICNKSTSAKCVNEGYPHPRNCSICICPSGYGGAICDQRPPGCGRNLVATKKKQTINCKLGYQPGVRDQFDACNYLIAAPAGKQIEVDVQSISSGYEYGGCPMGGVEVKVQRKQRLTGYRFCSTKGSGGPIASRSNPLPVIIFNKVGTIATTFTYRYV
ncbi:hypothetical protein Angca_010293, partial [Angiostrongylus cantonensis]